MKRCVIAILCTMAVPNSLAEAAQGVLVGGPIGATDIGNAYLPKTAGVYLGLTDFLGYSSRRFNNNGDRSPGVSAGNVYAGYLMYEWPIQPFGFKIASGLQTGYEDPGHITLPGQREIQFKGWRDLYVDFLNVSHYVGPIFGEHVPSSAFPKEPYGLTLKAEYSMIFPTGHYDPGTLSTPGSGTTFYIPNAALTYLTPPDFLGGGVEFDLHAFYDIRSKETRDVARVPVLVTDDYFNGHVLDFDWAIAQKIGRVTFGVAGSYAFQLHADDVGTEEHKIPVAGGGDFAKLLQVGPIVQTAIPLIHGTFNVKALFGVAGRNVLESHAVVANLFFTL